MRPRRRTRTLAETILRAPFATMSNPDRLNHLPPAARAAQVCASDAAPGLEIRLRYVRKPHDGGHSLFVYPGKDLWGVPYEVWKQHEGRRPVRLWEWHGTGEGMIGGPAKRQAGVCFFGGKWEFPEHYSADELRAYAQKLEAWLADARYEFTPAWRERIERKIQSLRGGVVGKRLLTPCADSEL